MVLQEASECPIFSSNFKSSAPPPRFFKISDTSENMMLKWRIVFISISLVSDCLYSSLKGKQDREEKAEPNQAHLWAKQHEEEQ